MLIVYLSIIESGVKFFVENMIYIWVLFGVFLVVGFVIDYVW